MTNVFNAEAFPIDRITDEIIGDFDWGYTQLQTACTRRPCAYTDFLWVAHPSLWE